MKLRRMTALVLALVALVVPGPGPMMTPAPARAKGVDVFLNVTGGGKQKLNIAIPEFTVVAGQQRRSAAPLVDGLRRRRRPRRPARTAGPAR